MWVRNKKTGLAWEVFGELKERLSKSQDYEIIENKEIENKNLEELTVVELKNIASKKGIEGYYNMKKNELLNALKG